jgi:hypothetical protein
MKNIIQQDKLDKIIFKYLDLNLKGLEKRKPKYYEGIIFTYPDEYHGVLGYENDGNLFISYKLIDEISEVFGLEYSDTKYVIARWVSNRYQLEVMNTIREKKLNRKWMEIDYN